MLGCQIILFFQSLLIKLAYTAILLNKLRNMECKCIWVSVLQTTSYNFSRIATTGELCAGLVKAPKVHEKNPAQHMADLCQLENQSELIPAFVNMQTGIPKSVEYIRVDGASDEGPSHEEVQYWWTECHILKERVATLVTTRSSGYSYLNRVELQNGCLSLGHAHTFIPSTLGGSCYNQQIGEIDDNNFIGTWI